MNQDEKVLVVPASQIQLKTNPTREAAAEIINLAEELCWFYPRSRAETDESLKQIIPYILIRHEENYLLTQRIKQTESRLDGKKSLGLGGHINPGDLVHVLAPGELVNSGAWREMQEEIRIADYSTTQLRGVIYDDTSEVSRVHIGIVFEAITNSPDFTLLEPEKTRGEWVSKYHLSHHRPAMEGWSQIALDQFILI